MRITGTPLNDDSPGPGAKTATSCPPARRNSRVRRTELVTPFTCGRKLSVTIATRSFESLSVNQVCGVGVKDAVSKFADLFTNGKL